MTISPKDRKLLWVRSGNECAFPGCPQALAIFGLEGELTVVGEEAHIVSRSPDGPRGNQEVPRGLINGVPNLILLCPTHHRIIDEQPNIYPVEALRDIKDSHENRVRERQESEKTLRILTSEQFPEICEGAKTFAVWRVGDTLLAACAFGSDPVKVSSNRWRGTGLNFKAVSPSFGTKHLAVYSEADPDIEFSIEGEKFKIVEWSFDISSGRLIPFLEKSYDLQNLGQAPKVIRLAHALEGHCFSTDEVICHYQKEISAGEEPEVVIFRLREMGLSNPESVVSALERLREGFALDGAAAEAATTVQTELRAYAEADNAEEN